MHGYAHYDVKLHARDLYSKLKKVSKPSPAEDVEEPEPATNFDTDVIVS